jgi:hypothetical protein
VRYVTPLSQTRAWKCPTCKRVLPFARDVRWVACGGGRHEDGSFFHKIDDRCYPVSLEEIDPIELARWTGLLEWLDQVKLWQVPV